MYRYFAKKIITLIVLLFFVSITVFSVLFVIPGDPAQIILGINATPETLAKLRAELGLDQPFTTQYFQWIGNLVSGRGNWSINYDMSVYDLIVSRLAVTGPMALMAMIFAVIISSPWASTRPVIKTGQAMLPLCFLLNWALPRRNSGWVFC